MSTALALLIANLLNAALNVVAKYRAYVGDVNARLDAIDAGNASPIDASDVKQAFDDAQAEVDAGRALDP